jgi:hypothetical protein
MQDELAGLIDAWLPGATLDDDLAGLEFLQAGLGHEPGGGLGVDGVVVNGRMVAAGLLWWLKHLDQVLGGEEAPVGQQALVDAAELHDAKLGIVDAADLFARAAPCLAGAETQTTDHLVQHAIGKVDPLEQRRGLGVEQRCRQGLDHESLGIALLDGLAACLAEAQLAGSVVTEKIVLVWNSGLPG